MTAAPTPSRPGSRGILLALTSAACFGASIPASKFLLDDLAPLQLAGLLYLGAALAMLVPVLRNGSGFTRLDRNNAARLAGAVALGGIVGPVALLSGLALSSAGSVSLLLNLELAATAVVGVLLFREHLGRSTWLGVAGVVGAGVIVSTDSGWPGVWSASLVATACICWALDNHFTALIDGTTPAHTTFVKGIVAGSFTLTLGRLIEPWHARPAAIAAALLVGAVAYGVSILLYVVSAQEIGATRAQAFFATAPFLGAALAFAALGEPLGWPHLVAIAMLVPAVALVVAGQHEHKHTHVAADHTHSHRHDDGHHSHVHPGLAAWARHTHWHHHEPLEHSHPHWPDLHHRHRH